LLDQIHALQINNAACLVVTPLGIQFFGLEPRAPAGVKVIVVPRIIDGNVPMADLPELPDNGGSFGGHILYTSGTTGAYKKLKLDGLTEDKRSFLRARLFD
jgi:hypothetical protein